MEIKNTAEKARQFFLTNQTRDVDFRIDALTKLKASIKKNEENINKAIYNDFKKSAFETYVTETSMVLGEITNMIKHLKKWSKPKRVHSPLALFKSKCYLMPEPYGVALIIAPWNYPFQLMMVPTVGAIAAGNCVVMKPANYSKHTTELIEEIITSNFDPQYISIFKGGREVNAELLEQKFDYIFFTGSPELGKIVMEKASKNLTPVTLELGGKSPCIVTDKAKLDISAKRLAWGKLVNAGQTCIAPDYLFVHSKVKDEFLANLKKYIKEFYGDDASKSPDFPRIINNVQFEKMKHYIENQNIFIGGKTDKEDRYVEPTILDNVSPDSPVMQQEIFGPILPVMTFNNLQEVINFVNSRPRPLACYLFSEDKTEQNTILKSLSFGGGCVNDTLMHVANHHLPFGGVGNSGMGMYHGKFSFDTFSHIKAVVKKSTVVDIKEKYPPYSQKKLNFIKMAQ